jgi:hypothetical protein
MATNSGGSTSSSTSPVRSTLAPPRSGERSGASGDEAGSRTEEAADPSHSPSRHARTGTTSTLAPPRPSHPTRKSSGGSAAAGSIKPRSISFKRRAAPGDSGFSSAFGGPGQRRNLSGYPRNSFAAASQAGSEALARWRNNRRTQTLSVRGPEGDPDDPSSWTYPEPKIPSILPNSSAPDATPIPLVPFTVLCLCCFSEFCSAGGESKTRLLGCTRHAQLTQQLLASSLHSYQLPVPSSSS